jgi:hypothetical protein
MQITKTVTRHYEVLGVYPDAVHWTWGDFKELREKHNQPTAKFSHCFNCGHEFKDNERLIVCSISEKGNRFFCEKCAALYTDKEAHNG